EEALQVIIKLWTEDRATFDGKYYGLNDAVFAPKPIQRPYPPILIGGHGEKRTLKLVAKYGDMSNFSPWGTDRLERLLKALKNHCADEGRDYESITKTFLGYCLITDNEDEICDFNTKRAREQSITLDEYLEKQSSLPGAWAGSVEEITAQFQHLAVLGFSHFQVLFPYKRERETSEIFAEKVIANV
ncbi:MAG: LLM class flavin-dependent oxidoreductase, partial [Candidatus Thorarchaeota archaeon]